MDQATNKDSEKSEFLISAVWPQASFFPPLIHLFICHIRLAPGTNNPDRTAAESRCV